MVRVIQPKISQLHFRTFKIILKVVKSSVPQAFPPSHSFLFFFPPFPTRPFFMCKLLTAPSLIVLRESVFLLVNMRHCCLLSDYTLCVCVYPPGNGQKCAALPYPTFQWAVCVCVCLCVNDSRYRTHNQWACGLSIQLSSIIEYKFCVGL